jgi:hypothetical protein
MVTTHIFIPRHTKRPLVTDETHYNYNLAKIVDGANIRGSNPPHPEPRLEFPALLKLTRHKSPDYTVKDEQKRISD